MKSREHTNFTYNLTPRNRDHLAWWVAQITGTDVCQIREYLRELDADTELRNHVERLTAASARRGLADPVPRFGRRAGWYALVRATQPSRVVETGTDKGLGTVVLAAALLRNGKGRLTTIDLNPDSGYLVAGDYAAVTDRIIGDSADVIASDATSVDLFLHDSLHTFKHETAELVTVGSRLSPQALVLSDNAHDSDALAQWAETTGRTFSFFREEPEDHWAPGVGIGACWRAPANL